MTFLGAASMSASGRHSEAIVMAIRWPLLVRRTHKWLALVVGVQALLWTLTGFYMVVVHIDTIHGDHLVHAPAARPFDLSGLASPSTIVAAAPGDRKSTRLNSSH